jgi:acyl carrier protein
MDQELARKVIAIVAAIKRVPAESIRTDAAFDELGIDSLDKINILFELENEFDIDVPDEQARCITSVDEMIARLEEYVQQRANKGA